VTTVKMKLQLTPGNWYGWQMLPGYFGKPHVPYFSPILVKEVTPRKTGRKIITLGFINTLYAEGVQDFALDLRIMKHETDYLVTELLYGTDRTAIINRIGFDWLRNFCPGIWGERPPTSFRGIEQESVSHYLNALFGTYN